MIKKEKISKDNVVKFPTKLTDLEKEIEAVIFAAAEPLDVDTIENKVSKKSNVAKSLEKLQLEYSNRGINLVCIKNKWSFRTSPNLSHLMSQEKTVEKKLSRAAVETLAIIVYHQPVTRAEIEEIRGVAFGTNTLEILMELDWVKPGGRKDVPGRPIQYVTTDEFLSHFNLQKLSDLPTIDELGSAGLIDTNTISLTFTNFFFLNDCIYGFLCQVLPHAGLYFHRGKFTTVPFGFRRGFPFFLFRFCFPLHNFLPRLTPSVHLLYLQCRQLALLLLSHRLACRLILRIS
mgnify:CR=1 FL=1